MNNHHPPQPSLFAKLISLIVAAAALTLVFMFSLVLIPVLLLLGTGLWFYLRWKMKQWQQAMAEANVNQGWAQSEPAEESGHIIEGEAVVVEEYRCTESLSSPPPSDDGNLHR
jgi:hypothetical protein